jgi:hypothetical protein
VEKIDGTGIEGSKCTLALNYFHFPDSPESSSGLNLDLNLNSKIELIPPGALLEI